MVFSIAQFLQKFRFNALLSAFWFYGFSREFDDIDEHWRLQDSQKAIQIYLRRIECSWEKDDRKANNFASTCKNGQGFSSNMEKKKSFNVCCSHKSRFSRVKCRLLATRWSSDGSSVLWWPLGPLMTLSVSRLPSQLISLLEFHPIHEKRCYSSDCLRRQIESWKFSRTNFFSAAIKWEHLFNIWYHAFAIAASCLFLEGRQSTNWDFPTKIISDAENFPSNVVYLFRT